MNVEKICHFCSSHNNLCQNCLIVLSSFHSNEKLESENSIELSKKSVFFHQNQNVLRNENTELTDKTILLIGCGGIKRYNVLKSLKELKFKKIVYLSSEKSWAHSYFNDWIQADHENINNIEETIYAILKYQQKNYLKFDAIFTYDDYSVLIASFLANYFQLPSIPYELSKKIKNKFEFRKLCELKGISYPKYFIIYSKQRSSYIKMYKEKQFNAAISFDGKISINFPVIVKNPYGAGKDFVFKCNSLKEYNNCILNSIHLNEDHFDLLVEEYYDGLEIDIEILIQNNEIKFIAISDNFPAQEPCFYEQGGICPSERLTKQQQNEIKNLVTKWIRKLNFSNACLHFEARCKPKLITGDKFATNFLMPIEINQRLGGAETWSMIKSSFDVNLIQEYAKIALGIKLNDKDLLYKSNNPKFKSISHNILVNPTCFIDSLVIDLKEIQYDDSLVEISIFKQVAERLDSNTCIGWVTVKDEAGSIEKLNNKLNQLLKCFKFNFEVLE